MRLPPPPPSRSKPTHTDRARDAHSRHRDTIMPASDRDQQHEESSSDDEHPTQAVEPASSGGDEDQQSSPGARPAAEQPPQAAPPPARTDKAHVLAWHQKMYYLPAEAVVGLPPKGPKQLDDGAALGGILASKSPEMWKDACHPKHLVVVAGKEGKSVYTTFAVKEHPNEERFLRLVAPSIADKLFPKLLEDLEAQQPDPALTTERQRLRKQALHWRSSDIDGRVQINPEWNGWERCTEPELRSCIKQHPAPRPGKRALTLANNGAEQHDPAPTLPPGVKSLKKIDVNEAVGFKVFQRPGAVYVLQFDAEAPAPPAAPGAVVDA